MLFMAAAAFNYRAKYELLTVGGLHGRGLNLNIYHHGKRNDFERGGTDD